MYGNYLLSARFTNTIYNISRNGSVSWRLGGKLSSFRLLDGLAWSGQHDAKIHSQNASHFTMSLLDNASNQKDNTSTHSTALVVEVDLIGMVASPKRRWPRPDGQLSHLRGNVQLLDNGNAFVCWSDNGYISEHSPDGDLLLEARFRSERLTTYRAYKFNFTMSPSEPPIIRSWVYGRSQREAVTVSYVSWNGATDVATWRFFGYEPARPDAVLIGETAKQGFETASTVTGFYSRVHGEAYDGLGQLLKRTEVVSTTTPPEWMDLASTSGSASLDYAPLGEWRIQAAAHGLQSCWTLQLERAVLFFVVAGLVTVAFACIARLVRRSSMRSPIRTSNKWL